MLRRDAVLRGDPGNDLTPDVIEALNRQLTTITFDLLALPRQSANAGTTDNGGKGNKGGNSK